VHSLGNAEISKVMADLSAKPEFQSLLRQDAAALLWSAEPLAILWASPAAQDLSRAIVTDSAGTVAGSLPAFAQIQALAKGRAPRTGQRLEKLRFETSALAPLATCACRIVALPGGGEALLTTFFGKPPQPAAAIQPAPAAASVHRPQPVAEPAPAAPPAPEPAAPPAPKMPRRILRFVWESDRDGRFTSVSENLAKVVGRDSGAIVGMTINEVLATRARDPLNIVTDLFARGETWSGRTLYWRITGSDEAVRVDLAGLPAYDRMRNLIGFRGFGLCRPDEVTPWKLPEPVAEPVAEPLAEPVAEVQVGPSVEAVPDEAPGAVDAGRLPFEVPSEAAAAEIPAGGSAEVEARDESSGASTPEPAPAAAVQEETPRWSEPFASVSGFVGATLGSAAPVPLKIIEEELDEATSVADVEPLAAPMQPNRETPQEETAEPAEDDSETQQPDMPAPNEAVVEEDPVYVVVEPAVKVVESAKSGVKPLSSAERSAFREIARALGARFDDEEHQRASSGAEIDRDSPVTEERLAAEPCAEATDGRVDEPEAADAEEAAIPVSVQPDDAAEREASIAEERGHALEARSGEAPSTARPPEAIILSPANDAAPDIGRVLDRLPVGVIVHRGETALFANRFILDLVGYEDLQAFEDEGGLPRLFRARPAALARAAFDVTAPLAIGTREGLSLAVEVRLTTVDWGGAPASMLMLRKVGESDPDLRLRAMELDMAAREQRLHEQSAILDTATDGVIVLDDRGRILSLNRAAEALFGYEQNEVAGEPLMMLLATESHLAALDYLESMRGDGMRSLLNDGREVLARVRQGGTIPLFMTLGSIADGSERKFCAVLRDITAFKKAEGELIAAKRAAEKASAQKSDFLAKISHEIRTPLNAIIGFAEVMIEERFGAIGNERYRDYVSDIHSSGQHVISLVNDLLDLAKIEAGRMELTFTSVNVNELVAACVALLQPQAARDRIVLRTSFAEKLPPVVADERSLRQITLNLLSNAVKFTDAGGQVIVSTAMTDAGEVVFRVRDTGIGMSESEVEAALEPFRQLATSRKGGGTGLGLPLTKALVEANRGALTISSRKNEGTLVEVVFPPTRVLAE
jgi:PAS domain S-box-containing protein